MYLPAVIPPFEDELLYSYILRLAEVNGFEDISLFLKLYVNDRRGLKYPTIKYYSEEPLNGLVKYLNPVLSSSGAPTDFLTLYLNHSMARFYHGYSQRKVYRRIFAQQFVTETGPTYTQRYGKRNRPVLNFCPECMEEDKFRYGLYYIHRIHQTPYAHICPLHGCRLMYYSGIPGKELFESKFDETPMIENHYSEDYAKMCSQLFQFNRDLNHRMIPWKKTAGEGIQNWLDYQRFITAINKEWVVPAKKQCHSKHEEPRTDLPILRLLYGYLRCGKDLSRIMSEKPSEIPLIKEKIAKAAVY